MKKRRKGLLGLLLAGVLALTACGSGGTADTVVLKIDNHDITKYEYMVYLYTTTQSFVSAAGEDVWNLDFDGQTADELVEERTISTLQSVLAAEEYAAAHDIALTDDQKEEAAAAAKQFLSTVDADALKKMEVDEEKLVPLMEASYLYSLVYDSIASECAVDETDIASLFKEYDVDPKAQSGEESGETTMYQSYMLSNFGLTEAPEVGKVVGPIKMDESKYFIIKTLEKTVPTEEEVKEKAETGYKDKIQTEYAEARIDEMVKAQKVEKVKSVWDTLEKFH